MGSLESFLDKGLSILIRKWNNSIKLIHLHPHLHLNFFFSEKKYLTTQAFKLETSKPNLDLPISSHFASHQLPGPVTDISPSHLCLSPSHHQWCCLSSASIITSWVQMLPTLSLSFFNLILYWAVRECLTGGFLCAVSSLLSPLLLISPCQGREEQTSCSQDGDKDMGWFYRTSSISFSIWWKGLFTTLFLYGSPFGLMTSIAPCFLGNL